MEKRGLCPSFFCGLSPELLRNFIRSGSGQNGRDSCFLYIRTTNPFPMRPLHLFCAALLFSLSFSACTREVWVNDIEPGVVEIRPGKTFSDSTFFFQIRTMPAVILVGFQNLAYFKTIPSLNDSSVYYSNFLRSLPYMAELSVCYQTPSDSLYKQIFFCNLRNMESAANQNHWTLTLDSLGFRFLTFCRSHPNHSGDSSSRPGTLPGCSAPNHPRCSVCQSGSCHQINFEKRRFPA